MPSEKEQLVQQEILICFGYCFKHSIANTVESICCLVFKVSINSSI